MLQIIIKLIGSLLVLLGIVFIYDARILTKKFFSFGDQNEGSTRTKDFRICNSYNRRINRIFFIIYEMVCL